MKKKFVFLTNSSERTIKELRDKLLRMGIDVGSDHFYTSALATLVRKGAKLVGTNPDLTGPIKNGIAPTTKTLISPIELSAWYYQVFLMKTQ